MNGALVRPVHYGPMRPFQGSVVEGKAYSFALKSRRQSLATGVDWLLLTQSPAACGSPASQTSWLARHITRSPRHAPTDGGYGRAFRRTRLPLPFLTHLAVPCKRLIYKICSNSDCTLYMAFGPIFKSTNGALRQLRAGARRQIVARLPAHRRQRLVPAGLPDAALAAASGGARIRDDGAGLPDRHLGRRRADRAGCRHHHHRRSAEARGGIVAKPTGRAPTNGSTTRSTAGSTTSSRVPSC